MKKTFLFIFLFFLLFTNVTAKESIFTLINNNNKCGETQLFNSYFITYKRLINEKDLSEKNISDIKYYLNIAFNIINKNNICTISELKQLDEKEKNIIYNALTNGLTIINKADSLYLEEEEKTESPNIIYERDTNSINIYDNNILINKIPLNNNKLTYTGSNRLYLVFVILYLLLPIIIFKYKKLKRIYLDFSYSIVISLLILLFISFLFKNEIGIVNNVVNLLKNVEKSSKKDIILDENNDIKVYPSYGDFYGMLLIPELKIANNIVFGDSIDLLKENIGHYTSSSFPGENKTIIYSGHNKKDLLKNLQDITINNEILIKTTYGEFTYEVYDIKIIEDTSWNDILIENDYETLIIYTCYPFNDLFYSSKRFVVYSKLIDEKWIVGEFND